MPRRGFSALDAVLLLYVLGYVPNVLLTRLTTTVRDPTLGRALSGIEVLPSALLVNLILTYLFIWLSGWHRDARGVHIGPFRVPFPRGYTLLSAVGSALVLCTVPLSYTFASVSIPFSQILMRGDILLIAPLVDVLFGRRVRWWSWTALGLVAVALTMVVFRRGGFHLPALAIVTVALYTIGYFLRLAVMTRFAKREDPRSMHAYFAEEKLASLPLSILAIAALSVFGGAGEPFAFSFMPLLQWNEPIFWSVLGLGLSITVVSLCASIILLDANENSYCVPLERSASLLAGLIASWLLFFGWGLPAPTPIEMVGAGLLIGAIVLLAVAPRREAARLAGR